MLPYHPVVFDKRVVINTRSHILNDLVVSEKFINKSMTVFQDVKVKGKNILQDNVNGTVIGSGNLATSASV